MTWAMLAYKPTTIWQLKDVLACWRQTDLREAYIGDVLWLLMRAQYPRTKIPAFSEYAAELREDRVRDTRSGEQIITELAEQIRERISRRKERPT